MRLRTLDLIRFGHFTDRRLDFSGGRFGLHLVYGPNETGKSTTLRALECLLYGFPMRTDDNFLHKNSELRVGAVFEDEQGHSFACVRRKGRQKTLRDEDDDRPADEARLTAMLGGIDREAFGRRFGLSYESLVAGGCELVAGGGDLGEILFAAGGGLAGLRQVRGELDEEARELFLPNGRRRINERLTALAEAKRAVREATLSIQQYQDDREALERLAAEETACRKRLDALRAERDRQDRFRSALRQVGRRRMLRAELQSVEDAPLLDEDFSQRRLRLDQSLAAQRQVLEQAAGRRDEADAERRSVDVPESVLAEADAIEQLREALGAHLKAEADLPDLQRRLELVEHDMESLLGELGRELRPEEAEQLQVPAGDRERVRELASEQAAVRQAVEQAEAAVERLQRRRERISRELDRAPEPVDLRPLRDALRAAGDAGRVSGQVAEAADEADAARESAEIELARLPGWDGGIEALERLPAPSAATVDRFEREFGELDRDLERAGERAEGLRRQLDAVVREIERLRTKRAVPTEEDLTDARAQRDALWRRVRARLDDRGSTEDEDPDEPPAATDALVEAYQQAVAGADETADRLRREAEDVARLADLLASRETLQQQLAEAAADRDARQAARDQRGGQWQKVWQEVGVAAGTPLEMRGWLLQCQRVRDTAAAAREAERVAERWRREAAELARRLSAAMDQPPASGPAALDDLIRAGIARQELAEEANEQLAELRQEAKQLDEQLDAARLERQEAAARRDRWQADWRAAAERIGLDGDAPAAAAQRRLDQIGELLGRRREQLQFRHRIDGIRSDAGRFAGRVAEVANRCAADLEDAPPADAVNELARRLAAGRRLQQRAAELDQRRAEAEKEMRAARDAIGRCEAEQQALCRAAGVERPEQLPEAERRANARRAAETQLRELDASLAELTRGESLDAFLDAAEQHEPAALEAEIARLDGEIDQLARTHEEVGKRVAVLADRLEGVSDESEAARRREQAVEVLAELAAESRQYIRLRLASGVLDRAIERYRQQNQGPVLRRASELLERLTCGSMAALRADFDAAGKPVLVGVRPGGEAVPVSGMSEGTADQLYLALRIASLEVHLERRNRMPLVVDDILIKFDDARSRAALQVLADLSDQTQVIFFTHHQRVVELAREAVDGERLWVQQLGDAHAAPRPAAEGVGFS